MPRILIAESLHEDCLKDTVGSFGGEVFFDVPLLDSYVETQGYEYYYHPDITSEDIERVIVAYDALIVRTKVVSANVFENGGKLKLVIRGGTGVNTIDLEAAKQQGVMVENTPGLNSISTAEFSFNFFFELFARRNIFIACIDIMERDDASILELQPEPYKGFELYGKKLSIIGLGAIGKEVAKRAKAFGMEVMAYSKSFNTSSTDQRVLDLGIKQAESLEEAFGFGDIVSFHVPLTDDTHHIVNEKTADWLKKGAYLVNTARPQLFDPNAINYAAETSIISGVAIDGDPDLILPFVSIARNSPHTPFLLTHHIADSTDEAQRDIAKTCINQAVQYFNHGKVINSVLP
ncbi:MAG: NAD(P)-binding domain-containing protein [Rickettsiales bacterium]|nr:NAD(P)-binding domain-containing protein [Rickettsiales bacterium]